MKTNKHLPKISRGNIVYLLFCSVITTFFGLVLPFAILIIFDRVVPNSATNTLYILFLIIIGSIVLDYIVKQKENAVISSIVKNFETRMTLNVFSSICTAKINEFNKYSAGEYLERIETIHQLKDFFGGEWVKAVINVITSLIIIVVIGFIDIGSGITIIIASAILFYSARKLSNQKNEKLTLKSDSEGASSSKIIEIVSNPINLKAAAMEYRMENLMDKLVSEREYQTTEFEKLESSFNLQLMLIQQVSVSIVLIHCGLSVINMEISQGVMAAVILLTNRFFSPYQQVMQTLSKWKTNTIYLDRITSILELGNQPTNTDKDIHIETITARGDISFKRSEITILSGDSGSGKTYLIKAISLESDPNIFDIKANNQKIITDNYLHWKNKVIRVDKNSGFVEGNIIDNLTCYQPDLYKAAYALSEAMGIKKTINELRMGFYTEISSNKSMPFSRQLTFCLAIIRALLSKKDIIIIDDIDLVYDKQFGINLINCFLPRSDSMICIFISNKLTTNSNKVKTLNLNKDFLLHE